MRVFSSACVRGSVPFLAGEGPGLTRLLTPAGGNLRAAVVLLFLRRMISAPFLCGGAGENVIRAAALLLGGQTITEAKTGRELVSR